MEGNLGNALWITLIGMGLVFIAILALWGMMALIVRLTTEREMVEEAENASEPADAPDFDRERRAAAAAVAVAVAMQARRPAKNLRAVEPGSPVSAWQAVHRASLLSQRAQTAKKKVVR